MTETKQSTEQSVTERNHVFIFTDISIDSMLEQQGLITIFLPYDGSIYPSSNFNEYNSNNYFVALLDMPVNLKIAELFMQSKELDNLTKDQCGIALSPYGVTWRDLVLNGQLTDNRRANTLDRAYTQFALLRSQTEQQAAELHFKRHPENNTFIFPFNDGLYKAVVKQTPDDSQSTINVTQLTDCNLFFEYSVVDDTKKHSISHHLFLYSEREGSSRVQLTDNELSKATAFSTALQKHRQSFYGTPKDLILLREYLLAANPPKLKVLPTIGFDKHSQYFVFPNIAYSQTGDKKPCLNKADGSHYFDISIETSEGCYDGVKPFGVCTDSFITLKTNSIAYKDFPTTFINTLSMMYGVKALLMFGFYISSVFSYVLKDYDFFPMLSLYGYPSPYGDDKRFLTRLFNRCFFIDSEGQKIKSAFNSDSELNKINQKANLVSALLDSRNYKKQYDYDALLPYYNRKALPTGATLAFVADTERFTNEVIKNFTVSLQFPSTCLAQIHPERQKLTAYTPEQLTVIGDYLLSNRTYFEKELPNVIRRYETHLKQKNISEKIAQNYAIALGGISCYFDLLNHRNMKALFSKENLVNYTIQRALHKGHCYLSIV